MQCSEIMLQKPFYVTTDAPASAAAAQMRVQNVGFLPVCDQELRVVGALTDRDLVDRLVADGRGSQTPVGELMSSEVYAVPASEEAAKAQALMQEYGIARVVCVDERGKLAGIVGKAQLSLGEN